MRRSTAAIYLGTFALGLLIGADLAVRADLRGSGIFPDVPRDSFFDEAVGALYEGGIITGYQDGRFGPNDPVTRGQVAVIMKRFADKMGADLTGTTRSSRSRATDSSSSSSAASAAPGAGTLSFATAQFDIPEGSNAATISVSRTGGSEGEVRVSWKTASGTAVAGEDFTQSSGQLTFDDGETSQTISVPLKNDSQGESTETFTVVLSNPTGGSAIGTNGTITLRILDNDGGSGSSSSTATTSSLPSAGGFRFGGSTYDIQENKGPLTVVVERTGGSTGSVDVQYEAVEFSGGADDAADFTPTSGTLTFASGETEKSFTVNITDDSSSAEGYEKFHVKLKNPTGGAVLLTTQAEVTIRDDDQSGLTAGSGTLQFDPDDYTIREGESGNVTIKRLSGAAGQITVRVQSNAGSAGSGDYHTVDSVLTFRHGESSKTVTVTIKTDNESESSPSEEQFSLSLSNPTGGATIGTPNSALITIDD